MSFLKSVRRGLSAGWRAYQGYKTPKWLEPAAEAPVDATPVPAGVAPRSNYMGQRYYYLAPDVAIARLVSGHHVFVDPLDEDVGVHLIVNGFWERWIERVVLRLIKPGDTVIEVGANLGYYTVMMASQIWPGGKMTTIEASPRLCRLLERTIDINGCASWVRLINGAAADKPGTLSFVISRSRSGSGHTEVPGSAEMGDRERVEVEALRLDDLGHDKVDLIRLDAEGSEILILRGAERLLKNPDITLCMEWSVPQMGSRGDVPAFVDWLAGQGFRFWSINVDATLSVRTPDEMKVIEPCDAIVSRKAPGGIDIRPN